ncbi:hypothetical protein KVR01_002302 [Diaporthe batatas]|uniref:uncharacterized protein n=1 Tax=Diaporthe batatas TaxID=748121 RepID=UPI001D040DF7|nr:uncharacterized protein KVR01_002302 [Diaporthe batatas]KAG8166613.1 hypothetical protein KVR01_002302 [Diaporthe batatas]
MASHLPYLMASALFLASLIASVSAATPSNGVEFLFPTQGATLHYNDYVQVQYTSEFEAPYLYTFCRAASGSVSQKQTQGVGGFNSTALIKLSWSGSDTPCWFNLKPSAGAAVGKGANSDNWSFDISERAATTVALSTSASPTATPSITSLSSMTTRTNPETSTEASSDVSTATSPDATTTAASAESTSRPSDETAEIVLDGVAASTTAATAETSSASSAGLSMGAQIGTGIGVAIAGILIGVGASIWYMRRRQQKARQGAFARIEAPPYGAGDWKPPALYSGEVPRQTPHQMPQQTHMPVRMAELRSPPPPASELHATGPVYYELPSHTTR